MSGQDQEEKECKSMENRGSWIKKSSKIKHNFIFAYKVIITRKLICQPNTETKFKN